MVEDPILKAYLRGESLQVAGQDGWVVIAVEVPVLHRKFPIGWGKRSQDKVKNAYPRGLRWMA